LLQAALVGPQGVGISDADMRLGLGGSARTLPAAPCGPGCYQASVRLQGQTTRATVTVDGEAVAFGLPRRWPPLGASALLARAERAWRGLRTLAWHERLGSDRTHVVHTSYLAVAPDRLRYQVAGGQAAILIGGRRWDRAPGEPWRRSQQLPVRQPVPYWQAVADAHLLGSARLGGRPTWRVSFFDPRTPAWFTVSIEKGTFRTLGLRMTANAHFMQASYGSFNRPVRLNPPPTGARR
jgi:hypothetical protein